MRLLSPRVCTRAPSSTQTPCLPSRRLFLSRRRCESAPSMHAPPTFGTWSACTTIPLLLRSLPDAAHPIPCCTGHGTSLQVRAPTGPLGCALHRSVPPLRYPRILCTSRRVGRDREVCVRHGALPVRQEPHRRAPGARQRGIPCRRDEAHAKPLTHPSGGLGQTHQPMPSRSGSSSSTCDPE
jgi:hypothetical protein